MDLKIVASKVVGQVAGTALPFSGPVAESLVQELLGAQDEQIKLLLAINSQLDRIVNGPWQTARLFLREAALPRRTPEQIAAALRRASEMLHEAIPLQQSGSLPRAQVLTDLAIVERMRGDSDLAGHYAIQAYQEARAAMGHLVQREPPLARLRGQRDRVARLTASGSLYDDIEWTAAVIADSRAATMLSFAPGGLAVQFPYANGEPVRWVSTEPLDFAYIAWFNYIRQWIRAAETQAPGSLKYTSLDILWYRFYNPGQLQRPEYRPLPPRAEVQAGAVDEVLHDLMRLALTGKLP